MTSSGKSYFTGKRIIIIGGTGFIGSHLLAKILKQKPSKILLISRGSSTERITEYLSQVDLKIYKSSREYVKQVVDFDADYLFMLGGNADPRLSLTDPRSDLEHNLLYNFDLFEKLQKIENKKIKIIFVSSVAVYGNGEKMPLKEIGSTIPKSPYGVSKLATEGYLRFFAQTCGLKGFSIRLFSTYGPGLRKQVVYDFVKRLLEDPTQLHIRGDGSEVRDLSYIDDQINGIVTLAHKAEYKGEIYNLGSGVGISVVDLASKISKLLHITPKIIYEKETKEIHHGTFWIADTAKLKKLKHISKIGIDDGLKKTIAWIKKV